MNPLISNTGLNEYKQMAYVLAMRPRNRIRELRKAAGLTQIQLASRTGISQPAISQLENDERPLDVDWMRTLAREFGCTPADLLPDEDNPDRLSEEERALLAAFRSAGEQQREMIRRVSEPVGADRDEGRRAA